jgi:hypothetical protein
MKYTNNQTGAMVTIISGAMWSLTTHICGSVLGYSVEETLLPVIIVWILVPFYIKLIRPAFIAGLILSIFGFILTFSHPSITRAPWYFFEQPFFHFTFILFLLSAIACIYFSYKSFKELSAKVREKPTFTNNQVGAITTLLAIIYWATVTQGLEEVCGIASPTLIIVIAICWIMLPFYIKRISGTFIAGIVVLLSLIVGVSATHSLREQAEIFPSFIEVDPLGMFTVSRYYSLFILFYLISFVCIYFSYGSYKELKESAVDKEML